MFNIEFLHEIRSCELGEIARYLAPGSKILEIGGGTGYQARILSGMGYDVTSIDIEDSNYKGEREFPIILYDGVHIPFPNKEFDIVFSSNVLEHIAHLDSMHQECCRVLKDKGYLLHAMPTGTWRFWSNITHYIQLFLYVGFCSLGFLSFGRWGKRKSLKGLLNVIKNNLLPTRHGEFGNAFTELATFSHFWWKRSLGRSGFTIELAQPIRIFYTGYMMLGRLLPIKIRHWLAYILGSASYLYLLRKKD